MKAAEIEPAEPLARQLLLFVQGAIVIAMMQDRPQAATEAKSAVITLLDGLTN